MRTPSLLPASLLAVSLAMAASGDASGRSGPDAPGAGSGDDPGPNLRKSALSLLLPGLGQMRLGETSRGMAFLTAEAGFWAGFAVFRTQGSLRKDSYIEMAGLFAGVLSASGRSDEYYRRISNWSSSDAYNQVIRREARVLHGDDLEAREAYYEVNRVAPDAEWRWESDAARQRYRDKRRDSAAAYRNSRNMLGLALANRVVSMLDAALLARRKGLSLTLSPAEGPAAARLSLTYSLP